MADLNEEEIIKFKENSDNKEYVLKMFPSIIALSVFTLALSNYVDSKEQFNKFLNIFVFSNICAAVKILMLYFFQSRNTSR